MRLIKENTMQFESFLSKLETEAIFNADKRPASVNYVPKSLIRSPQRSEDRSAGDDGFPNYLTKLSQFENELINIPDLQALISAYMNKLSEIRYYKELSLFLFDKGQNLKLEFTSRKEKDNKFSSELNKNTEHIFSDGKIKFINSGNNLSIIAVPVFEGTGKKGLIFIETPQKEINIFAADFKYLAILSGLFAAHLNLILKKKELSNAHKETQHYQSKLLKDCRLSAVGEFTIGISQEILSSLQIILSSIDLLETVSLQKTLLRPGLNPDKKNAAEINSIKKNVAKVDKLVKSVLKFSDLNKDHKFPFQPCCLNEALEEFLELFNSLSTSNNYEIVSDVENDLPPILSSPIYLKQMLISTFGLLKTAGSSGGGYLIRTKHQGDYVQLIILSTDPVEIDNDQEDINLKVLKNLITMHEGQIELSSEINKGTEIILNFPLKRSIC
jgi:K+-sensing histidine kinase KdpD